MIDDLFMTFREPVGDMPNDFDEFQHLCQRTAKRQMSMYNIPSSIEEAVRNEIGDADGAAEDIWAPFLKRYDQMVWSLGLAGEAGEFADQIKKLHGHGHEWNEEVRIKLAKELGDVMWYVAILANSLEYNLSEIAQMNVAKLKIRYKEGFTVEESKRRDQ